VRRYYLKIKNDIKKKRRFYKLALTHSSNCQKPKMNKIHRPKLECSKRRRDVYKRKEEILNLYCSELCSQRKIAKLMNCSFDVIKNILIENNIKIRPQKFYLKGKPSHKRLNLDEKKIVDLYVQKKKTIKEISKILNCSCNPIKRILRENKISTSIDYSKNLGGVWNKGLTKETDERMRKLSDLKKGRKFSEKHRINIGEAHIGIKRSKKSKEKQKKIMNDFWANKENKERRLKSIFGGLFKRPTKPEKIIISLIKENNLPFNYVGDGKIWFRGINHSFNPDFLSKNPKHIIEVFGDYWHNRKDMKKRDKERLKTYKKYGYKTLVIWGHELIKNKKPIENNFKVLNKVNKFIK